MLMSVGRTIVITQQSGLLSILYIRLEYMSLSEVPRQTFQNKLAVRNEHNQRQSSVVLKAKETDCWCEHLL